MNQIIEAQKTAMSKASQAQSDGALGIPPGFEEESFEEVISWEVPR